MLSFAGHIFVDTDNLEKAEKVFEAAKIFLETVGFEISEEGKIKEGSWFKEKIVYKIRNIFRSKEAKEIFEKTKKAIELQQIEKHQSEVTKNYAEAAAALLDSFKDIPNVAVTMGSLVIAKATVNGIPRVEIRQLTMEQVIQLGKNQSLLNNPIELLKRLDSSNVNLLS